MRPSVLRACQADRAWSGGDRGVDRYLDAMRRRTLLCIAGAVALAAPLSACGDTDDGAAADDGCSPVDSTLAVTAFDKLQFDADAYEAGAGCIEVTYTNDGSLAHTLLVKGQAGFKLSVGDTDSDTITLAAGTYTLYCDVAGHESAGMHAELTVS